MQLYFDIRPDFRLLFFRYWVVIVVFLFLVLSILVWWFVVAKDINAYLRYKKFLKIKKEEFLEMLNKHIDNLKNLSWKEFIVWLKEFFSIYRLSFDIYKELIDDKEKKFLEDFLYKDIYNENVEYILKKYLDVLKDKIYVDFVK